MSDFDDDLYDEAEWWDDEDRESPLGREGCLFPGQCLMPGMHYESECHTLAMLDTIDAGEEEQFAVSAANLKIFGELFVRQYFGPRCSEFEPECECCKRWKLLDELIASPF